MHILMHAYRRTKRTIRTSQDETPLAIELDEHIVVMPAATFCPPSHDAEPCIVAVEGLCSRACCPQRDPGRG